MGSGFDPSSRLHLRAGDTALCMGRTAIMPGGRARASTVFGVVHRSAGEVFTHLYLVPHLPEQRHLRGEVLLAAVFPGDDLSAARAFAARHLGLALCDETSEPVRAAA
ncbi:hypothetical protein [Aureimonas frigidaquae]|uniref:Glutamate synthase (NADH) small subunit n=1 Tax=Aureimonas frigidaquae TaxID=424757 RepID=A0A0P0Z1C6_9HYPH|nr:hypothetical protein [Aureimonas frigidaquae]BAT27798.1 glutamate synthase (NADH) small subunit [Aureimonas frigidaquae]